MILRRFSTNHALFCVLLDGIFAVLALKLPFLVRPYMAGISGMIKDLSSPKSIPAYAYILLGIIWVMIYFLNNQYDPKKTQGGGAGNCSVFFWKLFTSQIVQLIVKPVLNC